MSVAATAPSAPIAGRPRVGVIFGGLMLVLLLAALDQTIVATALPTIVGDLGGLNRLAWVTKIVTRAGLALSPGATWALVRMQEHGVAAARAMAEQDGVPAARINEVVAELVDGGLLTDGRERQLTPLGREHAERLVGARREELAAALADDSAHRRPEVVALLRALARELCGEPPARGPAAARAPAPVAASA